jgi:hypothetical protein
MSVEIKSIYLKNILIKFNLDPQIVLQKYKPRIIIREEESHYYKLKFTDIDISNYVTEFYKNGKNPAGYIDSNKDSIILVNSKGYFYEIDTDSFFINQDLDSVSILSSNLPKIIENQKYNSLKDNIKDTAGIKDLLISENQIFISLVENIFEGCFNTSIYKADLDNNDLIFKIFFRSNECVFPDTPHAAGGRMKIKNNQLIFSHGTYLNYNTFLYKDNKVTEFSINPAQDINSIFGKILSINLSDPDDYKVLSMGLRNPQGLYVNKKGKIFTAEHGPRGGDALNSIDNAFQNNGWPCKSYGTTYHFGHSYNEDDIDILGANNAYYKDEEKCLNNKEFKLPIYFFSPSIGASEIYQNDFSDYPLWEEDIFITSLKLKTLFRLKYTDNKVISQESFKIGSRIRDLLYLNGAIYLLTESPRVSLIKIEN